MTSAEAAALVSRGLEVIKIIDKRLYEQATGEKLERVMRLRRWVEEVYRRRGPI